eukprot:COSAG04_NODE_140_length_23600_cov_1779.264414_1_plen_132_part_00
MHGPALVQAAGSWSMDACCAVHGNECHRNYDHPLCYDHTSSSSWLFGLWPGPPQRFEPTGTDTHYQLVEADSWPHWGGSYGDLRIGAIIDGAPGGSHGYCHQGRTYRGTPDEICGGYGNWGATDVEVWYPR